MLKVIIASSILLCLVGIAQADPGNLVPKDITLPAACGPIPLVQKFAVDNGYTDLVKGNGFDSKSGRLLLLDKTEKKLVIVHIFPDNTACLVDVFKDIEFDREHLNQMLKTRI